MFKENREDIIVFGILSIIFFITAFTIRLHYINPIIDFGREAYLPVEMLKSKILYKEIFNLYNPLSLQINSLIFFVFGSKLNNLFFAGVLNAYICLGAIYLISRTIASKLISFSICTLTMAFGIFSPGIFNYIYPYTYAFPYALSAHLLAVLCCVYYIKGNTKFKPEYLAYLAFFFMGISAANKFEYIPSIIPMFFLICFIKPLDKFKILLCILSFLIIPVVSWGLVFYQGLTPQDFLNYMAFGKKFFSAKTLAHYYHLRFAFPIFEFINRNFINFQTMLGVIPAMILPVYLLLRLKDVKTKSIRIFCEILLVFLLISVSRQEVVEVIKSPENFSWVVISAFIFLITLIMQEINNDSTVESLINNKEKIILIFLTLTAIFSVIRCNFYISHVYGTFFLPLLFVVNLVFIVKYLPEYLNFLKGFAWEDIFCTVIIILSLQSVFINAGYLKYNANVYIKTHRGSFKASEYSGYAIKETLKYINSNMPAKSSFLMLPEGPMFNFLTDRDSNDMYYNLIPNHIETFGEDKIVNDLAKNPPDYILINNRDSSEYGRKYFCKNYAFKICKHIQKNYLLVKTIDNSIPQYILAQKSEEERKTLKKNKKYNLTIKIYKLNKLL